MSKHIRSLAAFVKGKIGNFKDSDIEYLYLGEKNLQGLLSLCSTKTKFSGDLKKSSLTALKFLLELLESESNFGKLFYNIDAENYKLLSLNLHIFQTEENKSVAFYIAKKIKLNRPYLVIEEFIISKSAQKEFLNWFSTQDNKVEQFESKRKKKKIEIFEEPEEEIKKHNLEELIEKYENKHLEGDFMIYQLFFYDILDPRFFNKYI